MSRRAKLSPRAASATSNQQPYDSNLENALRHGIERGANLIIRRPLLVVRLDLRPAHLAVPAENEHGGVRDPFELLAGVGRVAESVSIDDLAVRVREERERDLAFPVRLDLVDEGAALFGVVPADGVETDRLVLANELTEPGNLPGAVRSPVPSIENEDDLLTPRLGELHAFPGLVRQREIRGQITGNGCGRRCGRMGGRRGGQVTRRQDRESECSTRKRLHVASMHHRGSFVGRAGMEVRGMKVSLGDVHSRPVRIARLGTLTLEIVHRRRNKKE